MLTMMVYQVKGYKFGEVVTISFLRDGQNGAEDLHTLHKGVIELVTASISIKTT